MAIGELGDNFPVRALDRLERSVKTSGKGDEHEEFGNRKFLMEDEIRTHEHDGNLHDEAQHVPTALQDPPKEVDPVLAVYRREVKRIDSGFFRFFATEKPDDADVLERVGKTSARLIPKFVGDSLLLVRAFSDSDRNDGKKRNERQYDEHHPIVHVQPEREETEKDARVRKDF